MRRGMVILVAAATALAAAGSGPARPLSPAQGRVAIFYYPWYGTPAYDSGWQHWNQQGATPPGEVAFTVSIAGGALVTLPEALPTTTR